MVCGPHKNSLTAKLQIFASDDDIRALKVTMHAYTKACNFPSDYVFRSGDMDKRHIHDLYCYRIKGTFPIALHKYVS